MPRRSSSSMTVSILIGLCAMILHDYPQLWYAEYCWLLVLFYCQLQMALPCGYWKNCKWPWVWLRRYSRTVCSGIILRKVYSLYNSAYAKMFVYFTWCSWLSLKEGKLAQYLPPKATWSCWAANATVFKLIPIWVFAPNLTPCFPWNCTCIALLWFEFVAL